MREERSALVHGIPRLRVGDRVLAALDVDDDLREAEDRLLAAERGDHVGVRVEHDVEAPSGPGGDRLAQLGQARGRRIAHPLAEPGHKSLADQWVGRLLRVAGAEVDHLDPALLDAPGGLVQTDERVRGLALENGGDGHGQTVPVTKAQSDSNARSSAAISTCSSRRCA